MFVIFRRLLGNMVVRMKANQINAQDFSIMVQNLPKKARITTDQVHKFFEEKGSHFERLRVENVVFVYDLGGLIHLIQKREQAIVELKKIEAKGEQEGV